jgi:hypothetical protein
MAIQPGPVLNNLYLQACMLYGKDPTVDGNEDAEHGLTDSEWGGFWSSNDTETPGNGDGWTIDADTGMIENFTTAFQNEHELTVDPSNPDTYKVGTETARGAHALQIVNDGGLVMENGSINPELTSSMVVALANYPGASSYIATVPSVESLENATVGLRTDSPLLLNIGGVGTTEEDMGMSRNRPAHLSSDEFGYYEARDAWNKWAGENVNHIVTGHDGKQYVITNQSGRDDMYNLVPVDRMGAPESDTETNGWTLGYVLTGAAGWVPPGYL